jgi:hypothetical protein
MNNTPPYHLNKPNANKPYPCGSKVGPKPFNSTKIRPN